MATRQVEVAEGARRYRRSCGFGKVDVANDWDVLYADWPDELATGGVGPVEMKAFLVLLETRACPGVAAEGQFVRHGAEAVDGPFDLQNPGGVIVVELQDQAIEIGSGPISRALDETALP